MYIFIGLFLGFITPFQISMNNRFNRAINNQLIATFYIFVIGLLFTCVALLTSGQFVTIPLHALTHHFLWFASGSLLSIFFIFGNILVLSKIGITQTTLLPLIGQFSTSLLLDTNGWLHIPQQTLTIQKLFGIALLISGIIGVTYQPKNRNTSTKQSTNNVFFYQLLAILLGAGSTLQGAINGFLGNVLQSPLKAGLYNFIGGTLVLLIVIFIKRYTLKLSLTTLQQAPFWMYFGSIFGALFVIGSSFVVSQIGTNLFVMTTLLGITTGGLVVSHFGLVENPKKNVTLKQLCCLTIAIIGVVLQLF